MTTKGILRTGLDGQRTLEVRYENEPELEFPARKSERPARAILSA